MFSKRNGEPFPPGWWTLALASVFLIVVTVISFLAAVWAVSWQAAVTGVIVGILAVIATFITFYWADDMS